MTPAPAELVRLRRAASASVVWRHNGTPITEAARAALSEKDRSACQRRPDPRIVEELVAAERAFTATFGPDR